MKFRTELNLPFIGDYINYQSKILSLGSCFADSIGDRLIDLDFDCITNPFGVLFNPLALKNALEFEVHEEHFVQRDGTFYHLDYHSELNDKTEIGLAIKLKKQFDIANQQLYKADNLILTFGTAWVYKYNKTQRIIANCQKVPHQEFTKELLKLESLQIIYEAFFSRLFVENKNLRIILTVSPIRHLKDGLHENNLSKSTLHLLVDYLVKRFENVIYFPSYELVIDDLRDYRFYKEDLVHPTNQAINYVFNKFSDACFSDKTKYTVSVKEAITKLESHRFLGSNEKEIKAHEEKIEQLQKDFNNRKIS